MKCSCSLPELCTTEGANQYKAPYLLEYPGEEKHIGGRYLPFLVDPPRLGDTDSMLACHVMFEVILLIKYRIVRGTRVLNE